MVVLVGTTTILRAKKALPRGKALHKREFIKGLLRHIALNIVVVASVAVECSLVQSLLC